MTEEERKRFEEKGLQQEKLKHQLSEKEPDWKLYCDLVGNNEYTQSSYW